MAFAYYISQDYVKENTPIDSNVDVKLLNTVIRDVQELHIKPVLGTDLYDKFVTDINAGTVAGEYKTLLDDYIVPAMLSYIIAEAPLSITFKLRNNGALKQSNENGTPLTLQEMNKLEDKYLSKAKMRMELLVDYICEKESSFPEYTSNNDDGDRNPIGNSVGMGIYLGMTKRSDKRFP
jgi:hypothetical protein